MPVLSSRHNPALKQRRDESGQRPNLYSIIPHAILPTVDEMTGLNWVLA